MTTTPSDRTGPSGRTVVYLARHGHTPLNDSDVLRGMADPPLDQAGQDQAERLAVVLACRGPSAVVASPLHRTIQTARPLADRAGLAVLTDQRLVDRDYGRCTGVSKAEVIARWGSVDNAPGVETAAAVRERAVAALTDAAHRYGDPVVVVSHDAVNRQVLAAVDPGLGDPEAIPQDNGCFNTLELRDGRWAVLKVNEVPAGDLAGRTESH